MFGIGGVCGIVGLYNFPAKGDGLAGMLRRVAHRGPDAEGICETQSHGADVRLGHRRLSIIGLSEAANQPFEKDGLVIVYNGEVYNYAALKRELEAAGVRFRTTSDTEVLLEAWRRWGADCLNRLRGMFAFALLDRRTGRLILGRDPFGIKPLFVERRHGGVAFASELKALTPVLGDALELNPTALISSLMYYYVPQAHCVYREVEKLPPGHVAEISPDGVYRQTCYFDPRREFIRDSCREIGVSDLRTIIENSVAAHMVADVPVSAFLSGGLDSSLITAIAARQGHPIEGYTISFRAENQSSRRCPTTSSMRGGSPEPMASSCTRSRSPPTSRTCCRAWVAILDEPIGDAAAINAYLICKAARGRGIKVLLSGMGADELFGGPQAPRLHARRKVSEVAEIPPPRPAAAGHRPSARGAAEQGLSNRPLCQTVPGFRRPARGARLPAQLHPLGGVGVPWSAQPGPVRCRGPSGRRARRIVRPVPLGELRRPGEQHVLHRRAPFSPWPQPCLHRSRQHGRLDRVPYVDREVAAAAFGISGGRKIEGRETKAVLKKAAEPYLPKEVIYRPKALFSAPLRAWIRRDLQPMVEELLMMGGRMVSSGFLNAGFLRRVVDEARAGMVDRSKEIWQLMTLESWLQQQSAPL
jgi:asparagine synthase (glutamine-hydrolysing)